MPKKYPPLTPKEVINILNKRGFKFVGQEGSHRQYDGIIKERKRKVTVDMAEKDFDNFLMQNMIRQSGLTRDEFYCSTKTTAQKINKRVNKNL